MSRRQKASPEAQLLIRCSREGAWEELGELGALARAATNWDRVALLANSHGVTLLVLPLFQALAERGCLPEPALAALRNGARLSVARNMRLRAALVEVLSECQRQGVQLVVLKGAAVERLAYDGRQVRPSTDIDIMCREEEYEQAQGVLLSLGYAPEEGIGLPHRHSHDETYFDRHFYRADRRVRVELHVDAIKLGVKPRHTESIWDRAVPLEVDGAPALALSLEDQVLTLSIHLHRHGFNRLIWFKDLDLLVRRYGGELDWRKVVDAAQEEGAGASLWYTFHFLTRLLDTPVPSSVLRELRPGILTRWSYSTIWPEGRVLNLEGETKRRAVQFSIAESWRGVVPSLVLMGRRREKIGILLKRAGLP